MQRPRIDEVQSLEDKQERDLNAIITLKTSMNMDCAAEKNQLLELLLGRVHKRTRLLEDDEDDRDGSASVAATVRSNTTIRRPPLVPRSAASSGASSSSSSALALAQFRRDEDDGVVRSDEE